MFMKLIGILLLLSLTLGCGAYNSMNSAPGTFPNISQLVPNTATAGGAGFVLTVNGTNLGMGAVVYWNSVAHNASYVTGNQLTAAISATEVANQGMVPVYVHANGQNSNTVMFTVQ